MTVLSRSERVLQSDVSTVLLISPTTQSGLLLPERDVATVIVRRDSMCSCSRTRCVRQTRTSIRGCPGHTKPPRLRADGVLHIAAVLVVHCQAHDSSELQQARAAEMCVDWVADFSRYTAKFAATQSNLLLPLGGGSHRAT